MKGILGQKIGMTSMFSEQGVSIPVTIIKTLSNVVTNVSTIEKNGYNAIQLSTFDRRKKTVSKPVLGHFKKAKTNPKYFTKEIRNMTGLNLGDKVDLSIFKAGELVDVTSNSKGKGFAGSIKRHNQKIGPKSHGGGGGSKPIRLTGGIGDVVSNRVFKGRHMPGQMGNVKSTIQNLEIILVDQDNEAILVKGSIPGPRKCFVVVKEAIKGLKSKEPAKLIDTSLSKLKNQLVQEANKVGAQVNSSMDVKEIQKLINDARNAQEKSKKATRQKTNLDEVATKATSVKQETTSVDSKSEQKNIIKKEQKDLKKIDNQQEALKVNDQKTTTNVVTNKVIEIKQEKTSDQKKVAIAKDKVSKKIDNPKQTIRTKDTNDLSLTKEHIETKLQVKPSKKEVSPELKKLETNKDDNKEKEGNK